jgi:[acyl-carrier-protein] S-malonyltransferase
MNVGTKPTAGYHPDEKIAMTPWGPTRFINPIPNPERYKKVNKWALDNVAESAFQGDFDLLEMLLKTGDAMNLFNGDLNAHLTDCGVLHFAAIGGQTECIELLLEAGADPHLKTVVPYGKNPEDGETALDKAKKWNHDDIVAILEKAESDTPYGYYLPEGIANNTKVYGCKPHGTKPPKGWYSSRPGVAEREGFAPPKPPAGPPTAPPKAYEKGTYDANKQSGLKAPGEKVAPKGGVPTLPIGLLFPGQGSQYVKMLSGVKDMPEVKEMLDKAQKILGYDILEICLKGPESKLEETRYCQPAMFIAGLAALEKLKKENPNAVSQPQAVAGLSLGEYTALCAAGMLSFEDGLKLVKLRGESMQEAAGMSEQAMLSVAGLEQPKLTALCEQAQKSGGSDAVCTIANILFPKGFSCAGTKKAIETLKDLAEKNGALQARMLKTSGGFHTSLMMPAQKKLEAALTEMLPNMKPLEKAVYCNVNAKLMPAGTDPKEIVPLLRDQLSNPVLWEPAVKLMIADGMTEFYECGPMKQLKAMMKRIDANMWNNTKNIEV